MHKSSGKKYFNENKNKSIVKPGIQKKALIKLTC